MQAAATFLAVRSRSVAETRRRLGHLGYRSSLVEDVLSRLTELGYLDDEAFARAWIASRDRARPRGESALRRELSLKGIDRETVARLLMEREQGTGAPGPSADRMAAERLVSRHRASLLREVDPRARRQKAYAMLARSGFDPETCRDVAANLGLEEDESLEETDGP